MCTFFWLFSDAALGAPLYTHLKCRLTVCKYGLMPAGHRRYQFRDYTYNALCSDTFAIRRDRPRSHIARVIYRRCHQRRVHVLHKATRGYNQPAHIMLFMLPLRTHPPSNNCM